MGWSLGAMAARSWHGLSCSPPSFTNWQNVFVVMLAALKTHCNSTPASQSTGSNDAVALQPSWPLRSTKGQCPARPASTGYSDAKALTSTQ